MHSRFLLDVVVRHGPRVLQILPRKDQALLIGRDALSVLDLGLDVLNSVGRVDVQGNGLAGESLHEDLHATAQSEDQVKGGLLLNVVVGEGSLIVQLLATENQSLLIRGYSLLVLNLGLHSVDCVTLLDLKSDSFAGKGLDEYLHW